MTDSSSATTWITRGWSTTIGCSNRTSDSVDASYSAAAAESVCNRTDTGTSSVPWIRWQPGYGLASGASRACHRCAGGVVATAMCSPSTVPGLGADPAASTRFSDGYPVVGVVPGRGGQDRMWFGRMRGLWRVGGVGGVEVGVEADRVIERRATACRCCGGGRDSRVSVMAWVSMRMWADLDEGAVLVGGGGDGLAEPHRLAHIGHPVLGIQQRCGGGLARWWR